jgi:hypothetical protein
VEKLGKHIATNSCLHIRRLTDVHLPTLKRLVLASVQHAAKAHPAAGRSTAKKRAPRARKR